MPNETIADIVSEMRGMLCRHDKDPLDIPPQNDILYIESLKCEFMQRYADRIEAAAKREKELSLAICDKCEAGVFKTENDRLRSVYEKVLELAGCLTNMSIVDYVHYKATHATMTEDGCFMPIEDPVAHRYKLIENQMIPVFLMLKNAVREAKRIYVVSSVDAKVEK